MMLHHLDSCYKLRQTFFKILYFATFYDVKFQGNEIGHDKCSCMLGLNDHFTDSEIIGDKVDSYTGDDHYGQIFKRKKFDWCRDVT
jgi:hypothetical protein